MTKKNLLEWLAINNNYPINSISAEKFPHRSLKTIIGYHIGDGGKCACDP